MNKYSNRPTLRTALQSVAQRYYYSSVPLGVVGVVLLNVFSSVPPFFGWLLIAWFAVETVIKIALTFSRK